MGGWSPTTQSGRLRPPVLFFGSDNPVFFRHSLCFFSARYVECADPEFLPGPFGFDCYLEPSAENRGLVMKKRQVARLIANHSAVKYYGGDKREMGRSKPVIVDRLEYVVVPHSDQGA